MAQGRSAAVRFVIWTRVQNEHTLMYEAAFHLRAPLLRTQRLFLDARVLRACADAEKFPKTVTKGESPPNHLLL